MTRQGHVPFFSVLSRPRLGATLMLFLAAATPAAAEPLRVNSVVAKLESQTQVLSLTGEIVARETLTAAFPSAGRIEDVLVRVGDTVTKGQVLARVEQIQQQQSLRAAQAGLTSAQAGQTKAQQDSTRLDALLARGAATRSERDAAADSLRAADAQVMLAQAELDRAQKAMRDIELLAPEAATVTDRMAEPGQVVSAAQPLLQLVVGDRFDAVFNVPESVLTDPAKTSEVRLAALDRPAQSVTGTIREISPLVHPQTGTVKVTVSLEAPPAGLSYGDPVRGTVMQQMRDAISLPWTAISVLDGKPAVWVVNPEDNRVKLQTVQVRRYEEGRIILDSGLEAGAIVVTKGAQLLFPNRLVTLMEDVE